MNQDPTDEPQPPKAGWQFRLWHLLALVAGFAPIFALARLSEFIGIVLIFLGFLLIFGPVIIAAIFWDRRMRKATEKDRAKIDAFTEFCQFMGVCSLVILYWLLLFVCLCVFAFIIREF